MNDQITVSPESNYLCQVCHDGRRLTVLEICYACKRHGGRAVSGGLERPSITPPVRPLTERIARHLQQLAPHQRDRLTAQLMDEALARLTLLEETEHLYNELLMLVARKTEGESRHQTAVRYITLMESPPAVCQTVDLK